jgi:hypothetical protein
LGSADDGPLGTHLVDAAQQELAEAACLFDLPEHRLGQLLAQPVGARVPASLDLRAHGLDACRCATGTNEPDGEIVIDRVHTDRQSPAQGLPY